MNVYIRVDASFEIGTGHVMRCLTLAGALREQSVNVRFICREHKGNLVNFIMKNGYEVLKLPVPFSVEMLPNGPEHSHWLGVPMEVDAAETKAVLGNSPVNLLIVDHYGIDEQWEKEFKKVAAKIMVIDDLADRKHECDYLLDHNFFEQYQTRYQSLVPPYCKSFLGPSYVLLRREFFEQASNLKTRTGAVKRIFIFFGGSDETNETMTALISFLQLKRKDISADVVVGQTNPHRQELYSICHQYEHVNFHYQISNMAELMSKADLSIGAGGTTTWERCFLALPSIVISVAKNQEEICETLAKWNVIKYVGKKEAVSPSLITNHIQSLLENEKERTEMSRLSYQLMKDTFINQKSMITELLRLG